MKDFILRHKQWIAADFVFAIIVGISKSGAQFLIRDITDGIALGSFGRVPFFVMLALGLHLICIVFSLSGNWVQANMSNRFGAAIRVKLFNHLSRASQLELEKLKTGDLQSAFRNDTDQASRLLGLMSFFNQLVFLLIFETVFLAAINLRLTLIVIVSAVAIGFFTQNFLKVIKRYETASRKDLGDMSQSVLNIYDSADTIKLNNAQGFVSRIFNARRDSYNRNKLNSAKADTIRLVLQIGLNNAALFGCVIYLAHAAINGYASIGEVLAYVSLLSMLLAHIDNMFRRFAPLMGCIAAWERVKKLFDLPTKENASETQHSPSVIADSITISGINFGYDADSPIFKDFSLHLKKGLIHALTGESGSGKTTLIKILLGFYDAPGMRIEQDGAAIEGIQPGYVPSDNRLFNMSIYDNIALGDEGITREHCLNLAESVGFKGWIDSLPHGLDTLVAENAQNLSGGQAQAVCILRALATGRSILVMDEPFAALDADKETALLDTLARAKQDRIVIVTSHRVSSVEGCDVVVPL